MWIHVNSHCYCISHTYVCCVCCTMFVGANEEKKYYNTHRLFWCIRFFSSLLFVVCCCCCHITNYNGLRAQCIGRLLIWIYVFGLFFRVSVLKEFLFGGWRTHYFQWWTIWIWIWSKCLGGVCFAKKFLPKTKNRKNTIYFLTSFSPSFHYVWTRCLFEFNIVRIISNFHLCDQGVQNGW